MSLPSFLSNCFLIFQTHSIPSRRNAVFRDHCFSCFKDTAPRRQPGLISLQSQFPFILQRYRTLAAGISSSSITVFMFQKHCPTAPTGINFPPAPVFFILQRRRIPVSLVALVVLPFFNISNLSRARLPPHATKRAHQ